MVKILDKNKAYQDSLLKLHDYLTTNNIDIEQVYSKVDLEKKIANLQEEKSHFENTLFNLREAGITGSWSIANYRKNTIND